MQPASWPTLVHCLWVFKNQCLPRGAQSPHSLKSAWGTRPPLGVGLCSDSSWFCSVETGKDKEQCAPNCFYRASHRGHTRGWADSLQKLTPASAQMPGKGSDPWLPCHLRKSAGHWKQTINPGTSQMRSRWLPGTRFPNIPSSPFTLSPMWFPFEGV